VISASIGAVSVEPGQYGSHHQIATAAAEAKKEAKKIPGNSIFIERRRAGQHHAMEPIGSLAAFANVEPDAGRTHGQ
jgi:hypothetical protein